MVSQNLEQKKVLKPVVERRDKIEERQDAMAGQLTQIQDSVEFMLYLPLGDDVKKGERVQMYKYSPNITFSKDDDTQDGGNKGGHAYGVIRGISAH